MSLPEDANGNAMPVLGMATEPVIIITNSSTAPATEFEPGPWTFSSMATHYAKAGANASVVAASNNAHVSISAARHWEVEVLAGFNWISFISYSGSSVVFAVKKTWP